MDNYKHILVAVDLHPACDEFTVKAAASLANKYQSRLSILHAVEAINAYGATQAYAVLLEIEKQMMEESQVNLRKLSEKYNIPTGNQIVEMGSPKIVIIEFANKLGADLIVVGSHGRHGVKALLGSTADSVMHHARCDVMAVRLKDE